MIKSRFLKRRVSEEDKELEFSQEDFYTIRDYIYAKAGINFAMNKKDFLENRLKRRVMENNFDSFKDYYYYLKYNASDYEFRSLMDAVTINETKFFRNLPLLKSFEEVILPDLIDSKKFDKKVKILSAGCATGEEPYTLAMIMNEKNIYNYEIKAGDISNDALAHAKKGVYRETQFRSTEIKYKTKYFEKDSMGQYAIDDKLKRNIRFQYLNLADEMSLQRVGEIDIIFCRNVMIYFDNEFKKKLIKRFYDMLAPNGYLFLGHSESLFGLNNDFKMKTKNGIVVYKKEELDGKNISSRRF